MKRGMQIIAPFRPFAPESELHREIASFDWERALRMVLHSAELACHCPVYALTDVDTTLPVDMIQCKTTERRLMLWLLEVIGKYLASSMFDRDTVMLDVDQLVYRDLSPWFRKRVDLAVLVRPGPKHLDGGMPLLNGVQWFSWRGRDRLVGFYREALKLAKTLPEDQLRWGADQEALYRLLQPLKVGVHERSGLTVEMIQAEHVLEALNTEQKQQVTAGQMPWPSRAVLDFRWTRKTYMGAVYQQTIVKGAVLA